MSTLLAGCEAAVKPVSWVLPAHLDEASGLAMSVDGRLFVHNDEQAIIYEFDPQNGQLYPVLKISDPAVEADFEGIAILKDSFYLLTSDGLLYRADGALNFYSATVEAEVIDTGLKQQCEFEGLATFKQKLYLACKKFYVDKNQLSVYVFNPETRQIEDQIRIPLEDLELKKFRPSGIWVTQSLIYLVSARPRLVTVINHQGALVRHYVLPANQHRQPEGIAITPAGGLILADEGDKQDGQISIYQDMAGLTELSD